MAIVFTHLPLPNEALTTYERSIRERFISERLNNAGHETLLCYLTHEEKLFILGEGNKKARFYPIDNSSRRKHRKFYTSTALGAALREFKPELVVFKGMGYLLPYWLFKNRYIPARIGFIAGGNPKDILLPVSSVIYSEYNSQLTGVYAKQYRKGRALLFGKYIPDKDFSKGEEKEFDIVSVGSISKLKNHRALIPLFKDYSVLIVGDGPELDSLKKAALNMDNVVFKGQVAKQDVSGYIRKAKLMVHPSKFEGFPRVFAEAFAAGVPVVALKRAIRGEFPEGKAGLLVEEVDLIPKVKELLADEKTLKRLSSNAGLYAESFRGEVVLKQFLEGMNKAVAPYYKPYPAVWRLLGLPVCKFLWVLDYYYYYWGRKVKRKLGL